MIAPAPGVFGYARVPDVDYPVGLYVVAEHKGDEAEPKKWLIARTALESDGDGEGYSAFSRRGREEILWYEWVELAELDPAPPARGTKYVAIDCVNVGDGLDLSSLRAACPDELLRPHEAWASKDDFIGGSPRPATRAVEHHIGGSPVIGGSDSGPQRQQQTDVAAIVRQLEHGMKVAMTAAVGQIETKIDERFATVDARLAAVEDRAPVPAASQQRRTTERPACCSGSAGHRPTVRPPRRPPGVSSKQCQAARPRLLRFSRAPARDGRSAQAPTEAPPRSSPPPRGC